jgi:starvation-inducible DNA-binding protein
MLPELVALTMHAKQAHWNVTGPAFLTVHALTDELAADSRNWTDRIAERSLALGFPVDARPGTVAAVAAQFPAGHITDREAVTELADLIGAVAATARASLTTLEDADVVAHDLTTEVLEGLEKYRWMLEAQLR